MSKRVYKFRSAEFGLLNLKERRLKLSTIDDLNDPFDLCSLDITDPAIEYALNAYIEHFRCTTGLLCFSRNWDNLLLWSHYAKTPTPDCASDSISRTARQRTPSTSMSTTSRIFCRYAGRRT